VGIGEDGSLARLGDKRAGREVLPDGVAANRLQLFQDGPEREAAWNVHATYAKREYPWEGECSVEIVERGPVRAVARVTRTHRKTRLVQDIILYAGLPRIDFKTHVDWREKQTMLKVLFPLAVRAGHATFEVQFGALERPNHRNTSWDQEKFEVCGLRWADLSEGGYGVSLLNDSKYGHDVLGNALRLTLLRSTEYPDPDADQGAHDFTYSLLPHAGDWRAAETVRRAAELNIPLVALPAKSDQPPLSYLTVDGPAILETLKPAEDGDGVILRLYEPNGSRGRVTVKHRLPFAQVIKCNLVEENEGPAPAGKGMFSFDIKPFQVCTFRMR
jgi:alpha-mannosidase